MPAQIIDGTALAQELRTEVQLQVQKLDTTPGLAVVLIGDDPASKQYVGIKQKAAREAGIMYSLYTFPENAPEQEVFDTITWLNNDEHIHAILIQLPVPEALPQQRIIDAMDHTKDVDGFHPTSVAQYMNNERTIAPGLDLGIVQMITSTKEQLQGKKALIIAKSDVFTSTLAHTLEPLGIETQTIDPNDGNIHDAIQHADIVISAVGRPQWITGDMIREHAILIDVGTTLVDGVTLGDFDFESCKEKASWISPVPGGVGPMTVAMLLKNTVALAREQLI